MKLLHGCACATRVYLCYEDVPTALRGCYEDVPVLQGHYSESSESQSAVKNSGGEQPQSLGVSAAPPSVEWYWVATSTGFRLTEIAEI